MMSRIKFLTALLMLFMQVQTWAGTRTFEGTMPLDLKVNEQNLVLNGSGIRHKYWFDLFIGGLYLKEKSTDARKIIEADEYMAIRIEVVSEMITAKRLEEGMRSEFKRVTNGNTREFDARIEQLVKAFREDVKIGDMYDLIYTPGIGFKIYKNNKLKSHTQGLDFKRLLFTIWLGEDPADEGLKKGMLGLINKKGLE